MKWKKLGFLFNTTDEIEGLKDTAGSPIPMFLEKNLYRIFSTARNELGIGHTVYIDVNMDTLKIVNIGKRPCFYPGKRGCFDDNGVFLSSILKKSDGTIKGWYAGFDVGAMTRFNASIGLCTSKDNGVTFTRDFEGPIIPLDKNHPYFTTAPYVILDNDIYKMWFVSCHGWSMEGDRWTHHYNIEYAESKNGIDWIRYDKPAIDFQDKYEYAIARPCVIKEKGLYKMWFCSRATQNIATYRIRYAESPDGINWTRYDNQKGLDLSESGWDSDMICYPNVFDYKGDRYMLHCGNAYGRSGFGIAVLEEE